MSLKRMPLTMAEFETLVNVYMKLKSTVDESARINILAEVEMSLSAHAEAVMKALPAFLSNNQSSSAALNPDDEVTLSLRSVQEIGDVVLEQSYA